MLVIQGRPRLEDPWEEIRTGLWDHDRIKGINLNAHLAHAVLELSSFFPRRETEISVIVLYGKEVESVSLEAFKLLIDKAHECRTYGIGMCFLAASDKLKTALHHHCPHERFTFFDNLGQIVNLFPEQIQKPQEEPSQNHELDFS